MTPSHRLLSEIYEQSVAPVIEDTGKGIDQLAAFSAGIEAIEQKFKQYEAAITRFNNSIKALERLSNDPLLLKLAETLENKEADGYYHPDGDHPDGGEMSIAEAHKYDIFHIFTEENFRASIEGRALSPMDIVYRNNAGNG